MPINVEKHPLHVHKPIIDAYIIYDRNFSYLCMQLLKTVTKIYEQFAR